MRRHKLAAPATRPQAAPAPLSDTPSPLHSARQTVPKRAIFLAGAKRTSLWAISKVPARRTGAAHHGAPSLHLTRAPQRTAIHHSAPSRSILKNEATRHCAVCAVSSPTQRNTAQPGATIPSPFRKIEPMCHSVTPHRAGAIQTQLSILDPRSSSNFPHPPTGERPIT
jgi:hypothetical protein